MLDHSAFITGLARNCAAALPATLERLAGIGASFRDAHFILVTNDNTDATDELLKAWCAAGPRRLLLSLDGIDKAFPDRIERIAFARNVYLAEMRRQIAAGASFDWLMIADLDGPNETLATGELFEDALKAAPADWGGLFANQQAAYYDILALRHRAWCPGDCWTELHEAMNRRFGRSSPEAAQRRIVGNRQVRILPDEPAIPVGSAFGGFAIYKVSATAGAWYRARDHAGHHASEHVYFNEACTANGARLYILPSLLNSAPARHLQPGAGAVGRPWLQPAPPLQAGPQVRAGGSMQGLRCKLAKAQRIVRDEGATALLSAVAGTLANRLSVSSWRAHRRAADARRARAQLDKVAGSDMTATEKFSRIYQEQLWLRVNPELNTDRSLSGQGSTLQSTDVLRRELELFLARLNARRLLDVPCGDFNWMKTVNLPAGCEYIGGDIVPSLIAELNITYASDGPPARRAFRVVNITRDAFEPADVWLCKDCVQHLSNADILAALRNFCRSAVTYALISNHSDVDANIDIPTGGFRHVDLTLAPFNLPAPALKLADAPVDGELRYIGVWTRRSLAAHLLADGLEGNTDQSGTDAPAPLDALPHPH